MNTNIFDLVMGLWTLGASRIAGGDHHASVTYREEWYLLGGFSYVQSEQTQANMMQIYNPTSNSWRVGPSYPGLGKGSYVAAVLGDQIYVCSGLWYQDYSTLSKPPFNANPTDCYRFNGDTNSWYQVPDLLVGVNHAAAGTDGNKLYVFGGRDTRANIPANGLATTQIYDPATMSWSYGPDMPVERGGTGNAPYLNGKFYVVGGECITCLYEQNDNNIIAKVTTCVNPPPPPDTTTTTTTTTTTPNLKSQTPNNTNTICLRSHTTQIQSNHACVGV
jgi:N-acetylneuraminic acid mutarotase